MMKKSVLLLCSIFMLLFAACQNSDSELPDTQAPEQLAITKSEPTATSVVLSLSATDNSEGDISYTVTYNDQTKTAKGKSGEQVSVTVDGLTRLTAYKFTVVATDAAGNASAAKTISYLAVEPGAKFEYKGVSKMASAGKFTKGYNYLFTTQEETVTVEFELLDEGLSNVKTSLYDYTSGTEVKLGTTVTGNKITYTLQGQSAGVQLVLACKFETSAGLRVTKHWGYNVGDFNLPDTESPSGLEVAKGKVGGQDLELLLNANDDSGEVTYQITYNGKTDEFTTVAGVEAVYYVEGLALNTPYSFSVVAVDPYGRDTEAKTIAITTSADANASAGRVYEGIDIEKENPGFNDFEKGYTYKFINKGSKVEVQFELLDTRVGIVATLRGANDVELKSGNSNKISYTFSNAVAGEKIKVSARYQYQGGHSQTRYFNYVVGSETPKDTEAPTGLTATVGDVTSYSVQFLLAVDDATDIVTYRITDVATGVVVKEVAARTGVEGIVTVFGLDELKKYSFSIVAVDYAGNVSSAATASATTAKESTEEFVCSASGLTNASEGDAFSEGYSYVFKTVGSKVFIEFTIPEPRTGKELQIWVNNAEQKTAVTSEGGNKVSVTLLSQQPGTKLEIKCRMPNAEGLKTTEVFTYKVGESCE